MPTFPFPRRGFRRTRERASGLYFALGVDDLSLTPATGQALSYTRASARTLLDSQGRLTTIAHSVPAWAAQYNTGAALYEPVLDFQTGTTNQLVRSEDLSWWAVVGTPTRVAAAKKCGDVVLDLIGDDSAAAVEGYTLPASFSGNAVKAVSFFVAQGSSTSSLIRLRDTTAPANRLVAVLTWSAGLPVVTILGGNGVYIGAIACANGGFRLLFQTASVTAANVNQLEIYPATDSASTVTNQGTLYVGGAQAENASNPKAYVKTVATTQTTASDALSATVTIPLTLDFTVYLRLARPAWAGLITGWPGSMLLVGQPTSASNGRWYVEYDPLNQRVNAGLQQAGAGFVSFQAVPAGSLFDCCAQFTLMTTAGKSRIDVGSGFSAYSSTVAAISQWDSNTLLLGGESGVTIDAGIRKVIVAPGARTLTEMRGLLV